MSNKQNDIYEEKKAELEEEERQAEELEQEEAEKLEREMIDSAAQMIAEMFRPRKAKNKKGQK